MALLLVLASGRTINAMRSASQWREVASPAPRRLERRARAARGGRQETHMAGNNSFDITSGVDMQEVDNAVNQTNKELGQRYDFRTVKFEIVLDKEKKNITLTAPDDYRLDLIWDVLLSKMAKRNVPLKNLKREAALESAGSTKKQLVTLQQGIPTEKAKEIVKWLKDQKYKKVTSAIQAEQVRVTSPSRDELQVVIAALKRQDFGIDLQFGNYRSS
jgi:uncharacterized protein YajQ (UPF0234 family)